MAGSTPAELTSNTMRPLRPGNVADALFVAGIDAMTRPATGEERERGESR